MKSNYIIIFALILTIAVAGCYHAGKQEVKEETAAVVAPVENNASNASTVVENTSVEVQEPQKSDLELVKEYIDAHPVQQFKGISERVFEVETVDSKKALSFRISTNDPAQESVYLVGVQFMVFLDLNVSNATGYNNDDDAIVATRKQWKRENYDFFEPWFGEVKIIECSVDTDCNDNNACTKDLCVNSKCSNARIITTDCP